MRSFVIAFAALLAAPAFGQTALSRPEITQQAVTPESVSGRLETAARQILAAGNRASRFANIDIAWGLDANEQRAMGGRVVVLISAVSQDASELPLKRVYIRSAAGVETELQRLGGEARDVPADLATRAAFGAHREDSFYVGPAAALIEPGDILLDFAVNRSGFRVLGLPVEPPAYFASIQTPIDPASGGLGAVRILFEREYIGFRLPPALEAAR
jgi:hypothetical protein